LVPCCQSRAVEGQSARQRGGIQCTATLMSFMGCCAASLFEKVQQTEPTGFIRVDNNFLVTVLSTVWNSSKSASAASSVGCCCESCNSCCCIVKSLRGGSAFGLVCRHWPRSLLPTHSACAGAPVRSRASPPLHFRPYASLHVPLQPPRCFGLLPRVPLIRLRSSLSGESSCPCPLSLVLQPRALPERFATTSAQPNAIAFYSHDDDPTLFHSRLLQSVYHC